MKAVFYKANQNQNWSVFTLADRVVTFAQPVL